MNIIRRNTIRWGNLFGRDSFFRKREENGRKDDSELKEYLKNRKLRQSEYNIMKRFEDNQTVIYNTLYDSIVILSEAESAEFFNPESRKSDSDLCCELFRLGILIGENEDEKALLDLQNQELIYNRSGMPSVTILPTQACNARCEYCFAEHNPKMTMTEDTVRDLIRFLKEHFQEGDRLLLRWFGGEPLLAVDRIDEIVDGINAAFNGKLEYRSLMFTNGSLLNEEIIGKAKESWHMEKIQLTLDGYGEEHNRRKNYLNQETDYYKKTIEEIGNLLDVGIKVDCRVNLDQDNIAQIDKICEDLKQYRDNPLFRPRFTVLRPSDCGGNRFRYITTEDLEWAYRIIYNKLIEYGFLKHICDLMPHRQREGCLKKSINKVIVGSDGKLYKCLQEGFRDESSVGTLSDGIWQSKMLRCSRNELHEGCKTCVYLPVCSGGCDAYWELSKTEKISPCVREKFFMDMLLDMMHQWGETLR